MEQETPPSRVERMTSAVSGVLLRPTTVRGTRSRPLAPAAVLLGLTVVYVLSGKVGLHFAFVHASASAVWPPTGIALGALLLLGYSVWPAIFVGAFLVNATTAGSLATSIGVATGNTLEGLVGAWLVNRFAGGRHAFGRSQDIFKFVALAGLLSTTLSATVGVTSLSLGGYARWADYGSIWFTWWLGDVGGSLIVTPLLLGWALKSDMRWSRQQFVEGGLLLLSVALTGSAVFAWPVLGRLPLAFLCLPPLAWAAFRFGQREVATTIAALALIATWATVRDLGPFVMRTQNESLLVLQAFLGTIAMMTLPMAALVAERKRSERERESFLARVQAARQEAEAASRAKDDFLAILSHELRTPLNSVLGYVSMLRAGQLPGKKAVHALAAVERNTQAQARIIDDLLEMSALIAGELQLGHVERVDLHDVVSEAIAMMAPEITAKKVAVRRAGDESGYVSGDRERLQQIVVNLLGNAVKFTPTGGQVTVRLQGVGQSVRIIVADNGGGIARDALPHIFERFRQADSSTTRRHGGLGLGLAIVKHLVTLHGGTVRAESEGLGRGATLTVEFPSIPSRTDGASAAGSPSPA